MTDDDCPIKFWVPGVPAPGGSKKAFLNSKTGEIVVRDDCDRNSWWRTEVAIEATKVMVGRKPLAGCLECFYTFYMPRPASHFRGGKNADQLKTEAPPYPITKPDVTKLIRSTEDAMTGIVWRDDAQVAFQQARKCYCHPGGPHPFPGVWIEVGECDEASQVL